MASSFAIDPEQGVVDQKEDPEEVEKKKPAPSNVEKPDKTAAKSAPTSSPGGGKWGSVQASFRGLSTLLALLLIGLGIIFIVLLCLMLYDAVVSDKQDKTTNNTPNLCISRSCLEESAFLLDNMNSSVDPCQDFYNFACGNFRNIHAQTDFGDLSGVLQQNVDAKIEAILNEPLPAVSFKVTAEFQVKRFYQTCTSDFDVSVQGANSLVKQLSNIGGWDGAGTYSGIFDINNAVNWAMTNFGSTPFFQINVVQDEETPAPGIDEHVYRVEIAKSSTQLSGWQVNLDNDPKYRNGFKAFVKTVLAQIRTDLPSSFNDIDSAVQDIVDTEIEIVGVLSNASRAEKTVYVALENLQSNFSNPILYADILSSYFSEIGGLSKETRIRIAHANYLTLVSQYLQGNYSVDTQKKFNNYIGWKCIEPFIYEMGWAFKQAAEVWDYLKYQTRYNFDSTKSRCIDRVQNYMTDGLSNLFIRRHFGNDANSETNAIAQFTKQALINRVNGFSWMTNYTRYNVTRKLRNTNDFFGYPSQLLDTASIDKQYSSKLSPMDKSHVDNLLNLVKFNRYLIGEKYAKHTISRDDWPSIKIFNVDWDYDNFNNNVYYTAGLLQSPIFDIGLPLALNFGMMGRFLGRGYVEAIDPTSNMRGPDGSPGKLWDDKTKTNFDSQVVSCRSQLFNGSIFRDYYTTLNWQDSSALRSSYQAFKQALHSQKDINVPGLLKWTADQIFFLSFTQTFCQNDRVTFISDPILVDAMLKQTPEFSKAFSCPSSSPYSNKNAVCPGF